MCLVRLRATYPCWRASRLLSFTLVFLRGRGGFMVKGLMIPHSKAGFLRWCALRARAEAEGCAVTTLIAIATPHNHQHHHHQPHHYTTTPFLSPSSSALHN